MTIDYQKIVNIGQVTSISTEEYERLLKISFKERNYLKGKNEYNREFAHKRAYERIYLSASYKNESIENKAIITANINFPESKVLAEYLISMGYNKELIGKLIIAITYIKLAKLKPSNTEDEAKRIKIYETHLKNLIHKLGSKYVRNPHPETTLNKIIEIYALNPELLDKSKKRIKKID